ncbi:unnamed protein product [Symbiodinium microadriaticum]|nr:unnamed protein product [Symbiodinium microadriaticum]CAE7873264.1 unnamed protein product [Symbiodinium sp. KB8]
MVQTHSRRKELDVPDWLKDEWKKGNKGQIARQLQEDFIKRMEITIKRKNEKEVLVEEGWYTKEEMLQDLNWSEQNLYDNEWEYWVKIREHGKRRQACSYEENVKKMKEVDQEPENMLGIENGLKDFSMALVPEDKPEASEAPHPSSHKFAQSKDALEKFTNSVMTKIGKLRLYVNVEQRMKQATLVCSRAAATEAKIRTARKCFQKDAPSDAKAKASARSAIRTARNVIKDVGLEKARGIGGLLPLAKISEDHSEKGSHSLLSKKLGLALPIPLIETPSECIHGTAARIPRISIKGWVEYFLKHNHWHILAGLRKPDKVREQKIWKAWWERYRVHDPAHAIFEAADKGQVDLCRTAAVVLHGDEGKGRRRQAFFVLSFHSVLGRGTNQSVPSKQVLSKATKKVRKPYLKMNLNFKGHSFTTRFVTGVLPRAAYGDQDIHFFDLLSAAYEDAKFLGTVGLEDRQGNKYWLCCLKTIGDWPFLAKAGALQRTYANAVKSINQVASGICHLCEAGCAHAPFEQIETRRPKWLSTLGASSPFKHWPAAVAIVQNRQTLAEHFAFDLFHTFHLGVGKYFVASVLAILSTLESGGSVELRFQQLTAKYREWCRRSGRTMFVSKLTKDLITWEATSDYPKGTWFKGNLTTTLLEWIESLDGSVTDSMLVLALDATKAINRFFRILYSEGVWLEVETAAETGELLSKFLRRYGELAKQAHFDDVTLWPLPPKLHPLQHFAIELLACARGGRAAMNPLTYSTQMSEDLVGRPSRLSRRVATRLVVGRTLERYLSSAYSEFVRAGLLIETKAK